MSLKLSEFCSYLTPRASSVRVDAENVNHIVPTPIKQSDGEKTISLVVICVKINFSAVHGGKVISCEKIVNRKHIDVSLFFDLLELFGATVVMNERTAQLMERDWANKEWTQKRVDMVNKTDFDADFGRI